MFKLNTKITLNQPFLSLFLTIIDNNNEYNSDNIPCVSSYIDPYAESYADSYAEPYPNPYADPYADLCTDTCTDPYTNSKAKPQDNDNELHSTTARRKTINRTEEEKKIKKI
ncbi:hypothetical protein C2G38_2176777 [Gigaspora rosea]|uniref:Uncharacterized protein n=1 Tax=Gigaspora rosea TaxID=44941 RepID=A0A397VFY8_9GLOM|nr:hypothetical protein C2G38_2176777 [Gigaspora rosea]